MTDDARRYVEAAFSEVLDGLPAHVDQHTTFDRLGLDSVTNLNIVARLERDLGELPATLLFEHTTMAEVAGFLRTRFADRFAAPPPAAPPPADRPAVSRPAVGRPDDIAVIGVSGRYPGAPDVPALWRRVSAGDVCVEEIPADRWDWRTYFDERDGIPGRTYGRWGGFLPDVDRFDAAFFRILPRDAERMDPQQRLFLETSWNLLEDAGYLAAATREPDTGVFVGTMYDTYGRIGAGEWSRGVLTGPDAPAWSIANRVSYFFDLHGPSYAVDSACSSSLTSVHLAVQSLRTGECRMAIAGGVNLILHPGHYVSLSAAGMLSHDGRCRVFDERADGYVPGEGVGAVLLKPLAAAVADGDAVWGVIRASHVNNDGRTVGYTVPSPAAQAELVARTHRRAEVDPRTVTCIETHGTGTVLGDPIELAGLSRAFGSGGGRCAITSVKSNIGHLEGAAGIAGLTKLLLQLRHRRIAPCAELGTVNPKIELDGTPFYPPRELTDWVRPTVDGVTHPLRAGVSSFGAGGANAHVLVEEHLPAPADDDPRPRWADATEHVVLLSARTAGQLTALARSLADRLDGPEPAATLAEVAYTSQVGRAELAHRCAVMTGDLPDLLAALRSGPEPSDRVFVGTAGPAQPGAAVFAEEEGAAMLRQLVANGKLARAGLLWTLGAPVDWRPCWGPRPPARARFPEYPFDRQRYWYTGGTDPAITAPASWSAPRGTVTAEPDPDHDPVPPVGGPATPPVERELRLIACGFLMIDESAVDMDADLLDLGFDSVSLTEFVDRVNERYGIDLVTHVVFDAPTLTDLARHLLDHHTAAVAG